MDVVEQAIRDAHTRGLTEGQSKSDHVLAIRLAEAQLRTAGMLAGMTRDAIGATPAIYVPPQLEAQLRDVMQTIDKAKRAVEAAQREG